MLKDNGPNRGERTITFASAEIKNVSRLAEGRTAWAAIEEISSYKGILVLWTDPGAGIIVPLDALGVVSEEQFVSFVKAQIAGRRELDLV